MQPSIIANFQVIFIFSCLNFYAITSIAQQPGTWTWMDGSDKSVFSRTYRTLHFGEKGIPHPKNTPGNTPIEASWVDTDGDFWLMPGDHYDVLWRYDGENWAWMHGDTIFAKPVYYTTEAECDTNNTPGLRWQSSSTTDDAQNLWLYGGFGSLHEFENIPRQDGPAFSDLWKWNGKCWTLVAGDSTPYRPTVYGEKGVPHADNHPGIRNNAVMWCDSKNNLWLFGGDSIIRQRNDLWKWDGQNWTWMHGPKWYGKVEAIPENGLKISPNHPMPLSDASGVCLNDTMYLFGGCRLYITRSYLTRGYHNGLWQFDGDKWTLLSGSDSLEYQTSYQNPEGHLYQRMNSCMWKDPNNDLWVFGGQNNSAYYNDLWRWGGKTWHKVKTINQQQTQDAKPNPFGYYGEKGVADPNNMPGARSEPAYWIDSTGSFWVYGGNGMGSHKFTQKYVGWLADLWKFTPDYSVSRQETNPINGISLYPNPTSQQLHIELPKQLKLQHFTVVNSQGQVVHRFQSTGKQNFTLNTQNWPTGVYFLMGNTDDGLVREPFVVE